MCGRRNEAIEFKSKNCSRIHLVNELMVLAKRWRPDDFCVSLRHAIQKYERLLSFQSSGFDSPDYFPSINVVLQTIFRLILHFLFQFELCATNHFQNRISLWPFLWEDKISMKFQFSAILCCILASTKAMAFYKCTGNTPIKIDVCVLFVALP